MFCRNNCRHASWDSVLFCRNGGCAHYAMASIIHLKPFWLAAQLYLPNDLSGWRNGVNDDVFAQAPLRVGKNKDGEKNSRHCQSFSQSLWL